MIIDLLDDYLKDKPELKKAIEDNKPNYIPEDKNQMEVVIKPEALDLSALNTEEKSSLWRPEKFEEYLGQNNLKTILKSYISGCKEMEKVFPHMMIDGKAGTGKTTIAYLLAKYLDKTFVECVATTLSSQQQLVDKIVEAKGGILFIDEIHMINSKLANFILPILEDFQISGQRIKPFTLFSATTELGVLLKKFKPLVDRMKIQKTLEPYTIDQLTQLTKQYKNKTFPKHEVKEEVYKKIAGNCRGTPRIAIRYLESYIFMQIPIEEVFRTYSIVKDGITKQDIKVLKLLQEKEKGVGLKALSAYLGTSEANYLYTIEGYLIEKGLITITTRRQITEKGIQFLKGVQYGN